MWYDPWNSFEDEGEKNNAGNFWLEPWSIVSSCSPPAHFRREQSRHGQPNLWNRAERLRKTKRRSTRCLGSISFYWFPCLAVRSVRPPICFTILGGIGLESWSTNQQNAKKNTVDEVNLRKLFTELPVAALPMQVWPLQVISGFPSLPNLKLPSLLAVQFVMLSNCRLSKDGPDTTETRPNEWQLQRIFFLCCKAPAFSSIPQKLQWKSYVSYCFMSKLRILVSPNSSPLSQSIRICQVKPTAAQSQRRPSEPRQSWCQRRRPFFCESYSFKMFGNNLEPYLAIPIKMVNC